MNKFVLVTVNMSFLYLFTLDKQFWTKWHYVKLYSCFSSYFGIQ